MVRTIVDIKDLRNFICRGCVRVITNKGGYDIINGKYLGYYIAKGYVVAILC